MARANDPGSVRKLIEQAIMWVILAGTVGMAALVDQQINRLGSVQRIGNASLRLPANWVPTSEHGGARLSLRERGDELRARSVTVTFDDPGFSLGGWFSGEPSLRTGGDPVTLSDGRTAHIVVTRRSLESVYRARGVSELDVSAIVAAPDGADLVITLTQVSLGGRSDLETSVALMRRILATVRFN